MTTAILPGHDLPERTLRNADIQSLIELLQQQERHKLDVVVPASTIRFNGGNLELAGVDPVLTESGFFEVAGAYRPTSTVLQQTASQFDVPVRYLRKLHGGDESDLDLFDDNVNHWAGKATNKVLLRLLWGQHPDHPATAGIVRAILSDKYGIRDNFDTVVSLLDGMREVGLGADNIRGADLSEDRLYLRVDAPELKVSAPKLLEGYRSPWRDRQTEQSDIIHAGILVKNSEVGGGAFEIVPELRVRICDNGLQMTFDSLRKVHLGGRLEEGQISWSDSTRAAAAEFVKQQVKDAVASFLNVEYVQGAVAKLEADAGHEVDDVAKTIEVVAKAQSYTEGEAKGILAHFIRGGQATTGGLLQAVTSYAQEIEDVDRANDFAATGIAAMQSAKQYVTR